MDTSVLEYALIHVVSSVLPILIQEIDKTIVLTDDEKRQLTAITVSIRQTDRDLDSKQNGSSVPYATIKRLPPGSTPTFEVTIHVSSHASIPPLGTDDTRKRYLEQFAWDMAFMVMMTLLQLVRLLRKEVPVVAFNDQGHLLDRPLGKLAVNIIMRSDCMEKLSPILADFSQH